MFVTRRVERQQPLACGMRETSGRMMIRNVYVHAYSLQSCGIRVGLRYPVQSEEPSRKMFANKNERVETCMSLVDITSDIFLYKSVYVLTLAYICESWTLNDGHKKKNTSNGDEIPEEN